MPVRTTKKPLKSVRWVRRTDENKIVFLMRFCVLVCFCMFWCFGAMYLCFGALVCFGAFWCVLVCFGVFLVFWCVVIDEERRKTRFVITVLSVVRCCVCGVVCAVWYDVVLCGVVMWCDGVVCCLAAVVTCGVVCCSVLCCDVMWCGAVV